MNEARMVFLEVEEHLERFFGGLGAEGNRSGDGEAQEDLRLS